MFGFNVQTSYLCIHKQTINIMKVCDEPRSRKTPTGKIKFRTESTSKGLFNLYSSIDGKTWVLQKGNLTMDQVLQVQGTYLNNLNFYSMFNKRK